MTCDRAADSWYHVSDFSDSGETNHAVSADQHGGRRGDRHFSGGYSDQWADADLCA